VASTQDIRRRLRAVRNTRKITRAMEMVAGARLRKSEQRIRELRPYADRMMELMVGTARASTSLRSLPLLQRRESEQTVAIVPITGDRGLAGGFNAQVLRRAFAIESELRGEGKSVRWLVAGKKGGSTLRFRGFEVMNAYTGFADNPHYADAQGIAHRLAELYAAGEVDRVVVVYNAYVSALVQRVTVQDVLPIPEELLESSASFLGAQMTAMRNATKAAGELIDNLTLAMNRARQAEITQEILEVVAGADALTQ
jgi:F-type H+-transporting ATPase subunit gamma